MKSMEFAKRASDVFFWAFLIGTFFSMVMMFTSDRPYRSAACAVACLALTWLMAQINVRAKQLVREMAEEEEELAA